MDQSTTLQNNFIKMQWLISHNQIRSKLKIVTNAFFIKQILSNHRLISLVCKFEKQNSVGCEEKYKNTLEIFNCLICHFYIKLVKGIHISCDI